MKRILLLIIILFIATGCEAIYTLEINGDEYKEYLEVNNTNVSSWGSGEGSYQYSIRANAKGNIPTDYREVENYDTNNIRPGINYYHIELIDSPYNLGVKYDNIFAKNDYKYSNLVLTHFENFKMVLSSNDIIFNSGANSRVFIANPYLEKLTIVFKTNHEVLEHNADSIEDNAYYWQLNKDNYQHKEINIKISSSYNEDLKLWEKDSKGYFGTSSLVAIYIAIAGLGILALGYVLIKVKNSNR